MSATRLRGAREQCGGSKHRGVSLELAFPCQARSNTPLQPTKPRNILSALKYHACGFAAERQDVSQARFLSTRNSMEGYSFTETVRHSLRDAREQASALKHEYVSPEHLLLALARSKDRTLLQIWSGLDINPAELRSATLAGVPTGQVEHHPIDLPYTTNAKRVLEFAMREASALKDDAVEPTHILLGVARLGDDTAARVLREKGVTTDRIRAVLADLRGRPLDEVAVVSIDIKIQLRDGAVIQETFAGGDMAVLAFLSGYLLPD